MGNCLLHPQGGPSVPAGAGGGFESIGAIGQAAIRVRALNHLTLVRALQLSSGRDSLDHDCGSL